MLNLCYESGIVPEAGNTNTTITLGALRNPQSSGRDKLVGYGDKERVSSGDLHKVLRSSDEAVHMPGSSPLRE